MPMFSPRWTEEWRYVTPENIVDIEKWVAESGGEDNDPIRCGLWVSWYGASLTDAEFSDSFIEAK